MLIIPYWQTELVVRRMSEFPEIYNPNQLNLLHLFNQRNQCFYLRLSFT
jgi:hypothetical protein